MPHPLFQTNVWIKKNTTDCGQLFAPLLQAKQACMLMSFEIRVLFMCLCKHVGHQYTQKKIMNRVHMLKKLFLCNGILASWLLSPFLEENGVAMNIINTQQGSYMSFHLLWNKGLVMPQGPLPQSLRVRGTSMVSPYI